MSKLLTGWGAIIATAALLLVLKKMNLGVTSFNAFILILLAWSLGLVVLFRLLTRDQRQG